jgi:hypothetical protein|tara:strand:- start:2877 stop:4889 length:2013 start_codon:yes stop_codon:yes gene_type:complete
MAETHATYDADDQDETVTMAHRLFTAGKEHTEQWRQDAREAYDMMVGEQWKHDDLAILREQQRPAVTFNRIMRTINAVLGTQVNNRQETRFIPRELGDIQVNEIYTAAADWVRDQADAEDEESDAFEDMCIAGMGWIETRLDYEIEPDGMIRMDRIDPLEMYWDPGATKRNLSDARWVMRVRMMDLDEFNQTWPGVSVDAATAPWEGADDQTSKRTHVYPQDAYKEQQASRGGPQSKSRIRVAQIQWAVPVRRHRVGNSAREIDAETFVNLKPELEKRAIPFVSQQTYEWHQAFIAGNTVLDEGDCPFPGGPTLRAITYKRDRNKNTWYGILKAMIDPQRFGNKFFSQILDIINKNAKGGVMVEADAVDDFRDLEEKWARPDAIHRFRPGALGQGKVQPKPMPAWPQGLDRLLGFSLDAVHEVTGINLELLGFAGRNQPGVLEAQRKQSGLTIIAPLFDAMRRYRKEQGRVMLHYIRHYLSDGRLVRIVGQQGQQQYIPLVKQSDTARFDTIVDDAPTSPNMKERVYGSVIELLPTLANMGVPIPPELLDYAPIPSALSQKWKELIQSSAAASDPEQVKAQFDKLGWTIERLSDENRKLKDRKEELAAEIDLKTQQLEAEHQLKMDEARKELALKEYRVREELRLKELEIKGKLMIAEEESDAKQKAMVQ